MSVRTRKAIGTIGILFLLALYLPIAMVVGANYFAHAHTALQITYFLLAGIAWVVPAGWIIRWMSRSPDAGGNEL